MIVVLPNEPLATAKGIEIDPRTDLPPPVLLSDVATVVATDDDVDDVFDPKSTESEDRESFDEFITTESLF